MIGPAVSVWMTEVPSEDRSVCIPIECAGCAWLFDRAQSMQKNEPLSVSEIEMFCARRMPIVVSMDI